MAECDICKGEMREVDGCKKNWYSYEDGTKCQSLPYGEDWGDEANFEKDSRCHDCNCKFGKFHHLGCDMERCPKCRGQLISCDCTKESGII